jgi:hypothetical protein
MALSSKAASYLLLCKRCAPWMSRSFCDKIRPVTGEERLIEQVRRNDLPQQSKIGSNDILSSLITGA